MEVSWRTDGGRNNWLHRSAIGQKRSFDIVEEIAENPPTMRSIQTRIRCARVEPTQGPAAIRQEAQCQISRGNRWIFLKHLKSFR